MNTNNILGSYNGEPIYYRQPVFYGNERYRIISYDPIPKDPVVIIENMQEHLIITQMSKLEMIYDNLIKVNNDIQPLFGDMIYGKQ